MQSLVLKLSISKCLITSQAQKRFRQWNVQELQRNCETPRGMRWKGYDTLRAHNQEGTERSSGWEEWNPCGLYTYALHRLVGMMYPNTFSFKNQKTGVSRAKNAELSSEMANFQSFLGVLCFGFFRRINWKEVLHRILRKCTALNSWPFIRSCTWAVWYRTIIYSVERVQTRSQNKLQQAKLLYIKTKTWSGFIPQKTSVNQLVSSHDSQTCWLSIMNSLITVWTCTLRH